MEKNSILGLSKKLETKKQEDREQIEKHTLSELKRHAKHLRDGLSGELGTTKTAISDNLSEITGLINTLKVDTTELSGKTRTALIDDLGKIEQASEKNRQSALASMRWGWLRYSLPALLICATFLIANWGLMQFQASRLASIQGQISQAQQSLSRLPQGVQFRQDEAGESYLIYDTKPEHFQTTSGAWVSKLRKP